MATRSTGVVRLWIGTPVGRHESAARPFRFSISHEPRVLAAREASVRGRGATGPVLYTGF